MADQTAANASGQMPTGYRPPARSGAAPPPAGSQRPKGGTGGKRYVRTQAGANRYGKPIGSEIVAAPRDQRGAKAQSDKESVDRYKALVSGNPDQQAAAMKGLKDDQLQRLSEVAFSFQSSDPNVARLRAGVTLELRRRGINSKGLSGRGRGPADQKQTPAPIGPGVEVINYTTGERYRVATNAEKKAGRTAAADNNRAERAALAQAIAAEHKRQAAVKKAEAARVAAAKKAANQRIAAQRQNQALARRRASNLSRYKYAPNPGLVTLSIPDKARQQAAARGDALPGGRFPIRNISDLRNAVTAFGRAKPADREKIAKFICRKAKELNAEHLLGSGIREAAGYKQSADLSAMLEPEVIELAGKWRHGWIPLDGAAVSAKTHGRQGAKPWWSGGGGSKRTNVVKSGMDSNKPNALERSRGINRGARGGHSFTARRDSELRAGYQDYVSENEGYGEPMPFNDWVAEHQANTPSDMKPTPQGKQRTGAAKLSPGQLRGRHLANTQRRQDQRRTSRYLKPTVPATEKRKGEFSPGDVVHNGDEHAALIRSVHRPAGLNQSTPGAAVYEVKHLSGPRAGKVDKIHPAHMNSREYRRVTSKTYSEHEGKHFHSESKLAGALRHHFGVAEKPHGKQKSLEEKSLEATQARGGKLRPSERRRLAELRRARTSGTPVSYAPPSRTSRPTGNK